MAENKRVGRHFIGRDCVHRATVKRDLIVDGRLLPIKHECRVPNIGNNRVNKDNERVGGAAEKTPL